MCCSVRVCHCAVNYLIWYIAVCWGVLQGANHRDDCPIITAFQHNNCTWQLKVTIAEIQNLKRFVRQDTLPRNNGLSRGVLNLYFCVCMEVCRCVFMSRHTPIKQRPVSVGLFPWLHVCMTNIHTYRDYVYMYIYVCMCMYLWRLPVGLLSARIPKENTKEANRGHSHNLPWSRQHAGEKHRPKRGVVNCKSRD